MKKWNTPCEWFLGIYGTQRFDNEIKSLRKTLYKTQAALVDEDYEWFSKALLDDKKKWFVLFITSDVFGGVPKRIYKTMLRAAVYENDPSLNRAFIEPCINNFGHRRVITEFLNYLENGTNREKSGAVRALYWTIPKLEFPKNTKEFTFKNATRKSKELLHSLKDLERKKRDLFLKEFVKNTDLDVRRSLIPFLKLKPELYPDNLKPLVAKAVEIARTHEDNYIRQQVEVQLGSKKTSKPRPPFPGK